MDADPSRTTQPPPFDVHLEQGLSRSSGAPARRRALGRLAMVALSQSGAGWRSIQGSRPVDGPGRGADKRAQEVGDPPSPRLERRGAGVFSPDAVALCRALDRGCLAWSPSNLAADTRSATSSVGTATLTAFDPLAARVHLQDVRATSLIVVRTNYHPSWTAAVTDTKARLQLFNHQGQLAFLAPNDGSIRRSPEVSPQALDLARRC